MANTRTSQQNREYRIVTVLSTKENDELVISEAHMHEELGRLGEFRLTLASSNWDVQASKLLGTKATVNIHESGDTNRSYHGYVTEFSRAGDTSGLAVYQMTLRPWLWFLTRRSNCRVFQKKSVDAIIKQIFDEYSICNVKFNLGAEYEPREYCVQYRETDFNFVTRLMEQYGLYYYFEHLDGQDKMVVVDAVASWEEDKIPGPNSGEMLFRVDRSRAYSDGRSIYYWGEYDDVKPGKFVLDDYDYLHSKLVVDGGIRETVPADAKHAESDHEFYDYPGAYTKDKHGALFARVRMESVHALRTRFEAHTDSMEIRCGKSFKLAEHPVEAVNAQYNIVATSQFFRQPTDRDGAVDYSATFHAAPAKHEFRSAQTTPVPVVHGPHTATVVGKAGEEIWTDEHGRIVVQFHWDRLGSRNQDSSCWVRVAQVWAGNNWGGLFIPRIGQEVLVDFLEGDPDRPVVVGALYNDLHKPPYLPDQKYTRSTIKSDSTKGSGGYNELRFDDLKGSEQIYIHAEKNTDTYVKHDTMEWVGNDRHLVVKKDQHEKVEGNKTLSVKGNHIDKVEGNRDFDITKNYRHKIGGNTSFDTTGASHHKAGSTIAIEAGSDIHIKAGANVVIEAGASITLKAGGGFVVVGPSSVAVSGQPILLNSGGSAGSGAGCSPEAPASPTEPTLADDGTK